MLHPDLSAFVESLNANHVEFLVAGAHALAFHGRPRFTGDLDLLIRRSPENAARVLRALADFGFGTLDIAAADLLDEDAIVQLGMAPNRVDLLTSLTGIDFDKAWEARVEGKLDGVTVNYLDRETLIANKRAVGRPRDLADVDELLS